MGSDRTDAEVFLALEGRPDTAEICERLNYYTTKLAECNDEVDVLRDQLREIAALPQLAQTKRLIVLTRLASRASDNLSRLLEERAAYIDTVFNTGS